MNRIPAGMPGPLHAALLPQLPPRRTPAPAAGLFGTGSHLGAFVPVAAPTFAAFPSHPARPGRGGSFFPIPPQAARDGSTLTQGHRNDQQPDLATTRRPCP